MAKLIREGKEYEKLVRIANATELASKADASVHCGNVESSTTAEKLYIEAKSEWPGVKFSKSSHCNMCMSQYVRTNDFHA